MSAEGGLTTTGYIQHHLTNLTVCSDAARDAAGHCHGFWSFHLDTLVISGLLGILVFGLMAKVAGKPMGLLFHGTVGVQHAAMALYNQDEKARIIEAVQHVIKVETATEPKFQDYFVAAMQFPTAPSTDGDNATGRGRRSRLRERSR